MQGADTALRAGDDGGARYVARLARDRRDIGRAQALRWLAFRARLAPADRRRRDSDAYDRICRHVLVEEVATGRLVACFRYMILGSGAALAWPVVGDPDLRERRLRLAQQVDAASELLVTLEPSGLTVDERAEVAGWDSELQRLAAAALDPVVQVIPTYLSATGLVRLTRDPDGFLTESGRPMPKRPVAAQRRLTAPQDIQLGPLDINLGEADAVQVVGDDLVQCAHLDLDLARVEGPVGERGAVGLAL